MSIIKKVYTNNIFKRYISLLLGLIISAIVFNLLLRPINFVAGGTSGLSIIIEHLFKIDASTFIWIVYIIMFIISLIVLGKKSIVGILFATILYPVFVNLTNDITSIIVISYNDTFLITIFAGVLSGISAGLIYKNGFASSGLGIIAPIMNKCFQVSIGKTNFVLNTIIVSLGGYYFGFEMILYAIILLYINSYICNMIIVGVSSNKAIFIRSEKINMICKYVYERYHINATYLTTIDGINKTDMSLMVIPTFKYNLIKKELKQIDDSIFFVVCNSYELCHTKKNE